MLAATVIAMCLAAAWIGGEIALIVDRRLRRRRAVRAIRAGMTAGIERLADELVGAAAMIPAPPPPAPLQCQFTTNLIAAITGSHAAPSEVIGPSGPIGSLPPITAGLDAEHYRARPSHWAQRVMMDGDRQCMN